MLKDPFEDWCGNGLTFYVLLLLCFTEYTDQSTVIEKHSRVIAKCIRRLTPAWSKW